MMRWRLGLAALVLAVLCAFATMLHLARAEPVVRRASVTLPGWPAGARPVRVALLADVHLGSLAMDPARWARIVAHVAAARPDLVLIAGDFIDGKRPGDEREAIGTLGRPLARLRPPLGIVAVLGNHDHWTDAALVRRELAGAGVTLVVNGAVRRGPLAIAGVDDGYTGRARVGEAVAAARRLGGARLLLTHTPDVVPALPRDVTLALAGHSHCGQVVLPVIGPPFVPLRTGRRYVCGVVREGVRTTVVTAGLGTSDLPLRLGAPPDWWLLTLRPAGGVDGH